LTDASKVMVSSEKLKALIILDGNISPFSLSYQLRLAIKLQQRGTKHQPVPRSTSHFASSTRATDAYFDG
jgi:hypothetical protein